MDETSDSVPSFWFDYDPSQNDMFTDKKCYLRRTEFATKMGGVFELILFPCDYCGYSPLNVEEIISHIPVCKPQSYVVKLDHKVSYDEHNRMLLDIGVSAMKITDEDYDDPNDVFVPYLDDSFDNIERLIFEEMEVDNLNDASGSFEDDIPKIEIDDILNEMRMDSPIKNDLSNDAIYGDSDNNFNEFEDNDVENLSINPHECNYNFNQNEDFEENRSEDMTNDSNVLDQFLCVESCSSPDVQVEYKGVLFKYDASDQFNYEPDITISYPKEEDNVSAAAQDSNGLSFEVDLENNYDINNDTTYELEHYSNEDNTASNNHYFECSTSLPMTSEELQEDIQNYLNSELINDCTATYEYPNVKNETTDNQSNNRFDYTYNSDMLHEYIREQNRLFQSLDLVNPINSFEFPNTAHIEEHNIYQCNICLFYTESFQGFGVHMRVHSDVHFSCADCNFTTTKAYNLRQHQMFGHGTAYCCDNCDYVTYSSSKIRSHMRKKH